MSHRASGSGYPPDGSGSHPSRPVRMAEGDRRILANMAEERYDRDVRNPSLFGAGYRRTPSEQHRCAGLLCLPQQSQSAPRWHICGLLRAGVERHGRVAVRARMCRLPCYCNLEDRGIQAPLAALRGLRAVSPAPAEPQYGALRNDLEDHRRSNVRARRAVPSLPPDRRLERHQGSRLVQTSLIAISRVSSGVELALRLMSRKVQPWRILICGIAADFFLLSP